MATGDPQAVDENDQRVEQAKLLYEQAEYLLNDEIGFANSLRDTRRTSAGLVAVVVGIGIFRLDLFGSMSGELRLSAWIVLSICGLLTIAAGFILGGLWLIYTDRPIGYRKKMERDLERDGHEVPTLEQGKGSAALAVLDIDSRWRRILRKAEPSLVYQAKAFIFGLAYRRLAKANRRVRERIIRGRTLVFWALICVMLAFVLYIWGASLRGTGRESIEKDKTAISAEECG
jgi:hypothetical protein